MAMPMRFIIVALPISKGLKFDLTKEMLLMKYMSFYRLTRLLCVARENRSEQSDTILIESRMYYNSETIDS